MILVGALAEGALLTLLQLPAATSPLWLPVLAGAWALLFPVALLLQVRHQRLWSSKVYWIFSSSLHNPSASAGGRLGAALPRRCAATGQRCLRFSV